MNGDTSTNPAVRRLQWDTLRRLQRVQIFGAETAVGREIALELLSAGHPAGGMSLYGRRQVSFSWKQQELVVGPVHGNLPRADLAFVCTTPSFASQLLPILAGRATRVVDLSGHSRRDEANPFVLAEINGGDIGAFTELVALPQRTAVLLARVLWALEQRAGLASVDCVALLAAAIDGEAGIFGVREELTRVRGGEPPPPARERRLGNLLPVMAAEDAAGESGFIHDLVIDLRRILGRPDLPVDLFAVRTDVERCDSLALKVGLREPLAPQAAAELFAATPGVRVEADPAGPVPLECAGSGVVHVGRIRAGSTGPGSLCFFAVGDQLRTGAALAALEVACRLPSG